MTDIRERLEVFDRAEPPSKLWDAALAREPRSGGRYRRREGVKRAVVILTAFAVTGAATGFLISSFRRDTPAPPASKSVAVSPSSRDTLVVASPGGMLGAFDALWVESGGNELQKRDPGTGALLGTVRSTASDVNIYGVRTLAAGFGSVWWATGNSVVRIDPETLSTMATIELPGQAASITEGEGAVWVGVDSGRDLEIDPSSNHVVGRTSPISSPSGSLAVAPGILWSQADSEAARIEGYDLATGTKVGSNQILAQDLLYADGSIWGIRSEGRSSSLVRIGQSSGLVEQEIPFKGSALGLVADGYDLWVNVGGDPMRVDGKRGFIEGAPSRARIAYHPAAIAVAGGRVWVVQPDTNEIRSFPV